jgi:hypothetical protein
MKAIKPAESIQRSILLFVIIWFLLFNTSWYYSNEPYISLSNFFVSFGISLILGLVVNMPTSDFYEVEDSKYHFKVSGLPLIIKIIYTLFGMVAIYVGTLYSSDDVMSDSTIELIVEIVLLLFMLSAFVMQIINHLRNRFDFLTITDTEIHWHDKQAKRSSIKFVDVKSVKVNHGVITLELSSGDKQILKLTDLSLKSYSDAIKQAFQVLNYPLLDSKK